MYNFQKQAVEIAKYAIQYGVQVQLVKIDTKEGKLAIFGYAGSDSVAKSIQRRIDTFNMHSEKGF